MGSLTVLRSRCRISAAPDMPPVGLIRDLSRRDNAQKQIRTWSAGIIECFVAVLVQQTFVAPATVLNDSQKREGTDKPGMVDTKLLSLLIATPQARK